MSLDATQHFERIEADDDAAGIERVQEAVRLRVRISQIAADERAVSRARRPVLVLHAQDAVRLMLVTALVDAGLEVIEAATDREATALLERDPLVVVAHWYLSRERTARVFLEGLTLRQRAIVVSAEDRTELVDRLKALSRGLGAEFRETPYTEETMDAFVLRVLEIVEAI